MSHIAVERKRRRQINEHLKVLRSLTPCFYIKRGDQASIVEGVIEFIKELDQVLLSLESKKRRNSISPTPSPTPDSSFGLENVKEMGACCSSQVAEVEAKISGSNVVLRTISKRIPGQFLKIITLLDKLAFEILQINISTKEDTVLYSFLIKIGLECQLSLEDLVVEVQQSFCQDVICVNQSGL
ncbi:transcription factor MUTE-like [Telopea speciosissima]|uniref:transcription factor MUTE-like n=1 Tax=Telopea speciosissima TaxID=54955 RepID=UPI001CC5C049|nr:transcription factor MUTE-like [Telopea speciosissima]